MLNKLYNTLLGPRIRYSKLFYHGRNLLKYGGREEFFHNIIKYVQMNKIQGDYLEFGVYKGASFICAYKFAQILGLKMGFYAFDSFKGLPTGEESNNFFPGQYACTQAEFEFHINKAGIRSKDITIVPGWYEQTLPNNTIDTKASIVVVDCDLYKSTVPVLNFITPLIQDGTIIVFDDWYAYRCDSNAGEQKAFNDWLALNNFKAIRYLNYDYHGISFILRRRTQ